MQSVFVLVSSVLFLFAGCSLKPSEGDGKQAIQNQINQDSQGRIKLVEFQKMNGQLAEINSIKVYSLEFEAKFEFTEDCKWLVGVLDRKYGFQTSKLPSSALGGLAQFAEDTQNPGTVMKRGQQVKVTGLIRFEKKENGWSVDGIELNSTTPMADSGNTAAAVSPASPAAISMPTTIQQQTNQIPDRKVMMDMINTLRNISADKLQWALENNKGNDEIPTEADLNRFFSDKTFPTHPPGGHWIINAVNKPPASSKYGTLADIAKLMAAQSESDLSFENKTPEQIKNIVINDLRQIDAAENEWALKNGKTNGSLPTEADIASNLSNGRFPEHPPGGHFIINPVGTSPASSTYGKLGEF